MIEHIKESELYNSEGIKIITGVSALGKSTLLVNISKAVQKYHQDL